MLRLENVHIRRGDYVVADSIDLTLEQGKVYSVLGPNGTGKSSLMKTIFGEVAHKGTIRYGDEALSKIHLQSWRKRIGYMPQDTAAEASLTALEVVLLGRMDALHMHVGDDIITAPDMDVFKFQHFRRPTVSLTQSRRRTARRQTT